MIFKIILLLLGGLLLIYSSLYFAQEKLLFVPRSLNIDISQWLAKNYSHAELKITANDGTLLHGWLLRKPSYSEPMPLIIYFGGNAEEVSNMAYYHQPYFADWSLLLINYRGYGLSQGQPSETNFYRDALTIFDTIIRRTDIDSQRIVAMGRSLGTGVAVYLAAQRRLQAVILTSPYDSLTHVAQYHFPWVPITWLMKHPFNASAMAPTITAPLLALIAQRDTLIPPSYSHYLVQRWGGRHEVKLIEGADHNTIVDYEAYWQAIKIFLAQMRLRMEMTTPQIN